ncbi:Hypothetical protein GLP15_2009 [Giardia lamblia P15]|uniref:Uncharacterized protein n=1 Tax=Giardia intestinalis (strain P15) TaxID=658858 RepID=E1EZ69_GIAIA|nr:Hypothetical protein GLP15_2009 [Giardia lamblia P15]
MATPSPIRKHSQKQEERHAFWRSLLLKCPVFVPVQGSTHKLQKVTAYSISKHVNRTRANSQLTPIRTAPLSRSLTTTAPGSFQNTRTPRGSAVSSTIRSTPPIRKAGLTVSVLSGDSLLSPSNTISFTVFKHLPQSSLSGGLSARKSTAELSPSEWAHLEAMQTDLGLCEAEIAYSKVTIKSNPALGKAYFRRTKSLTEYNSAYRIAYKERTIVLARIQKSIKELRGSRIVLLRSLERLRALTIYMCSLINATRLICGKPVVLPGLNLYSEQNWLYDLRHELFMNRKTTAILLTVFKLFGRKKYEDVRFVVDAYFTSCITDFPPTLPLLEQELSQTFCMPTNKGASLRSTALDSSAFGVNSKTIGNNESSQPALEATYTPDDNMNNIGYFSRMDGLSMTDTIYDEDADLDRVIAGDVALYLLLGVSAEEVFDGDDLAVAWNTHIDNLINTYRRLSNVELEEVPSLQDLPIVDIPLLTGLQIVEMARTETFIVSDYINLLKDFDNVGLDVVRIPVDPSDPFETYRVNFDLSLLCDSADLKTFELDGKCISHSSLPSSKAVPSCPDETAHRPNNSSRSSVFSLTKSISVEEN